MARKPISVSHAIRHLAFLYRILDFTHNLKKNRYAFRRFLTGGKHKTQTQFLLLGFAFNIQKPCNWLNSGRFHMPLFEKIA